MSRLIPENPVLTKELRVRMRGSRAYWILLGYLGFIAVLVMVRYYTFSSEVASLGAGGSSADTLGAELFLWIIIPQIFLVLFITPAITSGTLTIEREQQTMDLLSMTPLTKFRIVIGKLLSAVMFTSLLIVSSIPLISICFMLGGIDPMQVLSVYIELIAGSVMIGAMGIMWSAISRTTTYAVMSTYISLFLVAVFTRFLLAGRVVTPTQSTGTDAFNTIGEVWFGNTFLGIKCPEGMGFSIFCILAGILMTASATVHIEMFPDRKAGVLRILTLMILGVQFASLDLWWINSWFRRGTGAVMAASIPPIGVLSITAVVLMLITPIFTTGPLASFEARRFWKYMFWGWSPAGLRRGKLASGLPFMAISAVLGVGVYLLVFVCIGKGSAGLRSGALSLGLPGLPPPAPVSLVGGPGETVTASNGVVSVQKSNGEVVRVSYLASNRIQIGTYYPNGSSSIDVKATWPANVPKLPPPPMMVPITPKTGDLLQGGIALVACVVGFGLICMLFSIVIRSRWVSLVAAYVLLLIIWMVPEVAMSGENTAAHPAFWTNLFYLSPTQVFVQICDPANYWQTRFLWFDHTPMWQVQTAMWAGLSLLALLVMLPFVRIIARENEPVPYEELIQLS